ncbi:MAG: hypothetical protein BMS9Abin02_1511 [Anaerolineae bacterium]|nr:MAG: hypothetical protein BMS9Abin02_1511 [Anaerolineae bacterium]
MYLWIIGLIVILIILFPIGLAILTRRKWGAPWIYFCAGILTFVIAQLIHLPLNRLLVKVGVLPDTLPEGSDLIIAALILGLTAALSEELIRAAGYFLLKKARGFGDGILLGLGHGGVEAMMVAVILAAGVSSFWYSQNIDLLPEAVSGEQFAVLIEAVETAKENPLIAIVPFIERVIALGYQVIFSILVLFAFKVGKWWYVLIAIIYHMLVNSAAVLTTSQLDNIWLAELILLILLAPGAIWFWNQRSKFTKTERQSSRSLVSDLPILSVSLKKEWLFQRRTKRLIIVLAVFLLFGMISPLLAKFTPQLLSSIEGAEQFADLIPEPTVVDAIAQYTSNLTQFGFILALLLGMGAVAGEKEKGTAAMVLSKPLPRWIFITSKFIGQAVVYFIAFALAAAAAYYYILYLFEPLAISSYLIANLLLLLWILVFAGITLLGSTLGRTTGAAAAISAGVGALVLIAGALPRYGALAPGGLLSWASQLAVGAEAAPNAGAVAGAIVLIALCLITSVAVLEQQEI